jgi:hypothetical protein
LPIYPFSVLVMFVHFSCPSRSCPLCMICDNIQYAENLARHFIRKFSYRTLPSAHIVPESYLIPDMCRYGRNSIGEL